MRMAQQLKPEMAVTERRTRQINLHATKQVMSPKRGFRDVTLSILIDSLSSSC